MQDNMVYTPEAHIPIASVSALNGVVYICFKKNKSDIYERITLDDFLSIVMEAAKRYRQERYDSFYD